MHGHMLGWGGATLATYHIRQIFTLPITKCDMSVVDLGGGPGHLPPPSPTFTLSPPVTMDEPLHAVLVYVVHLLVP